jgi:predicted ester cyclase
VIEHNKAVVQRFFQECWGRGGFDAADEIVVEDVVRNGQPVGRLGLIGIITAIRAALPDFHTETEDLIGEADRVAWRYSSGGSHTGEALLGIPARGNALR